MVLRFINDNGLVIGELNVPNHNSFIKLTLSQDRTAQTIQFDMSDYIASNHTTNLGEVLQFFVSSKLIAVYSNDGQLILQIPSKLIIPSIELNDTQHSIRFVQRIEPDKLPNVFSDYYFVNLDTLD